MPRTANQEMDYLDTKIYNFIIDWKKTHDGCSPSVRVIQFQCRISSTSIVDFHLARLENMGLIRRPEIRKNAIEIIGATWTPPGATT